MSSVTQLMVAQVNLGAPLLAQAHSCLIEGLQALRLTLLMETASAPYKCSATESKSLKSAN